MINLPLRKAYIVSPLLLLIACSLLSLFSLNVYENLEFNRHLIMQGELWRLLTAHFLHTNTMHLLLNLAGLILIWALHGEYYRWYSFLILTVIFSLAISVSLYFLSPNIVLYVGLSGLLHSFFIYGAIIDITNKIKTGWLLLLGILIKIIDEQINGADIMMSEIIDASVAIDAHLYGGVVGIIVCVVLLVYQYKRKNIK